MTSTLKEDIDKSLGLVRKSCLIISYVVAAIVFLVILLYVIALSVSIADGLALSGEGLIAALYSTLRNSVIIVSLLLVSIVFSSASRNMTPFGIKQTARLRVISLLLFVLVALDACFVVDYHGDIEVFGSQIEIIIATTSSLNIPALVLAAVAFCMSVIFRYGALLQEEEDALV